MQEIQFLFEDPNEQIKAKLIIEPLAPVSIVSTMPGSYYKSQTSPTKHNLCGILENILGWHFSLADRRKILKKILQIHKKKYRVKSLNRENSAVGYMPLIYHLFEIQPPYYKPAISCQYNDLWKQCLKADDKRHLGGTPNIDYSLIKEKVQLPKGENGKVTDQTLNEFFKKNQSKFPQYYTSPTLREFIVVEGFFRYCLMVNAHLFDALKRALAESNSAYLGTNEGWVDIKLEKL